jgi:hypothetical protein
LLDSQVCTVELARELKDLGGLSNHHQ